MSSNDESVRYVGENLGDDPSEATSKRLGSPLPSYVAGRRWNLRQAAHHLLDESSEEDGDGEEKEDSSPGVTGRALGETVGCDMWRTCGRLGDADWHAGVGTALDQRLLPIGDCKTVSMGTSLMCGDVIHQV
ncbi:UNVERIFIED_CONTAM: hypothetical protein Slati_2198000 [Sesamum latifolium]|uniref:Uncharacterized protein n=1 Tax=Sesamum latifolium TaxID=2727402 RepID=A0AAW2WTL7_9LAMI